MNMKEGIGYRYHRNGKVYEETWKDNQLMNKRLIQEKQEEKAPPKRTQAQRAQRQKKRIQHLAKKLKCNDFFRGFVRFNEYLQQSKQLKARSLSKIICS